ncbi:hypothetical protein ACFLVM_02645 [Chloroflexota bacterium]
MNQERIETKQNRRAKKLSKKRERMLQHSKYLAQLYKDAILKRLKRR